MGKWNSREISKLAKEDFEKAWLETASLLDTEKKERAFKKGGRPHVLFETSLRLRQAYLDLGFEEVINPLFIEDKEVRRQFGPEAAAVLDRCYYLAGLPRPDVGLGDNRIKKIENLGIKLERREDLQGVLHDYKKGVFDGDDLVLKMAEALGVSDALSAKVLDEVFPEYKALEPEASRMTLRSHMTSGWFLTLASVVGKRPMPIMLFSIDRCFRREQVEDETHLRSHHSASCVICDEEVTVHDGQAVAEGLLKPFGVSDFKFKPDEKRSKYYAPGTQTEVYARHPRTGWVEIATFGLYSPVALSNYKIEHPVMNLGLGVERLAMVLSGETDVREMVYPQFYGRVEYSDAELAGMIGFKKAPATAEGRRLAKSIVEVARTHATEASPCEFEVFQGDFLGREVVVKVVEEEENTRLLGPAALNAIYVAGGSIIGTNKPAEGMTPTGVSYIDGVANLAAAKIEEAAEAGEESVQVRVPMVKSLGDINLELEEAALRYITDRSKKVDVRGPVFTTVEAVFE